MNFNYRLNRRISLISLTALVFVGLLFIAFIETSTAQEQEPVEVEKNILILDEQDIKQIESGDTYSAGLILFKLRIIYERKGKEAINNAVPALITRTNNDLRKMDNLTEGEGELLIQMIRALSVTGDKRVKPVLLELMANKKISSHNIALGFLNLGKSVIPDIMDSLDSKDRITKGKTAFTLGNMYEFDETGEFFSDKYKKNIKKKILKLIKGKYDSDEIILPLSALGYFGDKTTVPVLEKIINNPSKTPQAEENKKFARKVLDTLNKRLQTDKLKK